MYNSYREQLLSGAASFTLESPTASRVIIDALMAALFALRAEFVDA